MIARLFGLFAALCLSGCSAASPEEDWPQPSPALWEVTAPTGQHGWLFGTVHALPDGVEWRTAQLDIISAEAGLLIVEIADLGSGQGQALFADMAKTPGQPVISTRVAAQDRPALLALMKRAGAEDGDFSQTETWAVALMLASAVRESDPANGVDRALIAKAGDILALETIAGQYRMFDTLTSKAQAALLAGTAREAQMPDPHDALRAWLTGDLEQLDQLGADGILGDPDLREALLVSRNHAWLDEVAQAIIAGRQPLVAVGAAHMQGEDGLPALFAERGYTVKRIQ